SIAREDRRGPSSLAVEPMPEPRRSRALEAFLCSEADQRSSWWPCRLIVTRCEYRRRPRSAQPLRIAHARIQRLEGRMPLSSPIATSSWGISSSLVPYSNRRLSWTFACLVAMRLEILTDLAAFVPLLVSLVHDDPARRKEARRAGGIVPSERCMHVRASFH